MTGKNSGVCQRPGCGQPAKRRGLCRRDYNAELAAEPVVVSPSGPSWPTGETADATGLRWSPIERTPDTHLVSEDGQLWGRPRKNTRGGLTKQHLDGEGYWSVSLVATDGHVFRERVHILVADAFLPPIPAGYIHVRHLNGVPTDNRIANLAWGTSRDNQLDLIRIGGNHAMNKETCPRGHLLEGNNLHRCLLPRRGCRACGSAMNYLRYYDLPDDYLQEVSDAYFEKYMSEAAA